MSPKQALEGAGTAALLGAPARAQLDQLAHWIKPLAARLDVAFTRRIARRYDPLRRRALLALTPGAAARLLAAGKPPAVFFEQVQYNGRRLARLNVPPAEVLEALRGYDALLEAVLANRFPRQHAQLEAACQQLRLCLALELNHAFYEVREAETQAFYGLVHAEQEARGLEDLLRRFVAILTRTFHAQAGRMALLGAVPAPPAKLLKRLLQPRYIDQGRDRELILDPFLRGQYASYWSVPVFQGRALAGILQLAFPIPYRWLPRELEMLQAVAERAMAALERTGLLHDLAERESQVRSLAARMLQAEEDERRRIGRELHDETGQELLSLRLQLELLEKTAPVDQRPELARARRQAEQIIHEVRRIMAALSPTVLERLGLAAALRQLARRFQQSAGARVRLRLAPGPGRPPRELETALYRAAQEALNNVARHARASFVNLSLRSTDRWLELLVRDDGAGFEVAAALARPDCFGLAGLRQRITLLGGEARLVSRPGQGTEVRVRLPALPAPPEPRGSATSRSYGQNTTSAHR